MRLRRLALVFSLLLVFPVVHAFAADNMAKLDKKTQDAIRVFKNAGASAKYFDKSYGYAVFPTIGKGAVGVGGAHGNGQVYEQGKLVGYAEMSQMTVGLSLGGKTFSVVPVSVDQRIVFSNYVSPKPSTQGFRLQVFLVGWFMPDGR